MSIIVAVVRDLICYKSALNQVKSPFSCPAHVAIITILLGLCANLLGFSIVITNSLYLIVVFKFVGQRHTTKEEYNNAYKTITVQPRKQRVRQWNALNLHLNLCIVRNLRNLNSRNNLCLVLHSSLLVQQQQEEV